MADGELVDTTNDHFVGVNDFGVVVAMPPVAPMAVDEALRLAAWLVAVADPGGDRFQQILTAVRST